MQRHDTNILVLNISIISGISPMKTLPCYPTIRKMDGRYVGWSSSRDIQKTGWNKKESRGTKMPNISEMGDQLNGHKVFFLTNLFHSQVLAGPTSI